MSVSALDKPVSNLAPHTSPPKAERKAKDAASSTADGQKADRVSFSLGENKPGKVFADQAAIAKDRASSDSLQDNTKSQGLLTQFTQSVKGWCGGHRPPKPDPCPPPPCNTKPPKPPKPCPGKPPKPDPCFGKPPERPTPCKPDPCYGKPPARPTPCKPDPCYGKPDPCYSTRSNDDLAKMLLDNFDAFKDPKQPWFVTTRAISDMAGRALTGNPAQDRHILLARELMRRPELLNAMDRHSSTGALDGLIDRQKIQMTLNSQSPLKYKDDDQLAREMLNHFDALRDPKYPDYISIDKLRRLAKWPTDHPVHGRLAWIAQEVLKRSEVKDQMDAGDNWCGADGWIRKSTLKAMSQ